MSMDTTLMNRDGGSYHGLGGFVAYKNRANSNFTNIYENTGLTLDGKSLLRYGAGFIANDRTSATYTHTLTNSFTTASMQNFTHGADFMFGGFSAGTAPVITNSFYLNTATCTGGSPCDGTLGGVSTGVANLQVSTNAPLSSWDFVNTWEERVSNYPKLRCPATASAAFCTEWNAAQ